jgi:hypothetical protein
VPWAFNYCEQDTLTSVLATYVGRHAAVTGQISNMDSAICGGHACHVNKRGFRNMRMEQLRETCKFGQILKSCYHSNSLMKPRSAVVQLNCIGRLALIDFPHARRPMLV